MVEKKKQPKMKEQAKEIIIPTVDTAPKEVVPPKETIVTPKEKEIFAPAGGMILILDADELSAMKSYIGYLIEDKLNKSIWTLENNKATDPTVLSKRIPIYKQILDKVGYVPKPKTQQQQGNTFRKPQNNQFQNKPSPEQPYGNEEDSYY